MIHVTIVILNWNRWQDTLDCLASLYEQNILAVTEMPQQIPEGIHQGQQLQTKAIVVDNGSTDGSIEQIQSVYPDIAIVALTQNRGFGGGMNAGIQQALDNNVDYVCLLNNDTLVGPDFVRRMLCHAQEDIGLMAPAIYYADAPETIWSTGGGFNWVLMEMTGNHGQGTPLPDKPFERQVLTGCTLLIRAEVFAKAGLFDERYFMYYEDLDLCVNAMRAGYRLMVVPKAAIWHKVSQSSGGAHSPAERFHVAVSSGRYFRKQMSAWQAPLIIPYRLLSASRWTLRLAKNGQWDAVRGYWRGLRQGWLGDPFAPAKF
ncbi:MAG: glycosyltransferase family 2 protein [Chloroflexota bacterium]